MTLTGMTSKILQDRRTGRINEIVGCEIMLFTCDAVILGIVERRADT